MRNAIQPGPLLVIRVNDVPGCVLAVGRFQHAIACARVVVPAAEGFQIHGAELPLPERVLNPRLEAAVLLLLANLQPILDEGDAAVHEIFLDGWADLQESVVFLLRTETHDVFDARSVVPATVENHDLTGSGEMRHVALYVHLALLTIGGSWQSHQTKNPWTHPLCNRSNR